MKKIISVIIVLMFALILIGNVMLYNTNGVTITIGQTYPPFTTYTLSAKETRTFEDYFQNIKLIPDTSEVIPDGMGWEFTVNDNGTVAEMNLIDKALVTDQRYIIENGEEFIEFCNSLISKYFY